MKISTMRLVDTWVGVPLCFLCTWVDRALALFRKRRTPLRRALFIELSEMGSAVICAAALRRFQERHPEAELHFLIFDSNREGIDIVGLVPPHRVHTLQHDNFLQIVAGVVRLAWRFRKLRFDAVVDLELFSCFTALLSFLTFAPIKAGFCSTTTAGLYRGDFLTHRVNFNSGVHIIYSYLALVEALEREGEIPAFKGTLDHLDTDPPDLPRDEKTESWLTAELRVEMPDLDLGRHRLILVNPDPGLLAIRGWGFDRFGLLVKALLEDPDRVVVLLGLSRSREACEAIRSGTDGRRCINFAGRDRGLRDLLSLFFLGDLLITNDSGPAHFATLSRIPTIVLYGPASAVTYGALNPLARNLSSGFHCSPCLTAMNRRDTRCTDNQCLQAITVEEVTRHAVELLASRG
jgi:ADP-heptose:LPS heptosyltransferase